MTIFDSIIDGISNLGGSIYDGIGDAGNYVYDSIFGGSDSSLTTPDVISATKVPLPSTVPVPPAPISIPSPTASGSSGGFFDSLFSSPQMTMATVSTGAQLLNGLFSRDAQAEKLAIDEALAREQIALEREKMDMSERIAAMNAEKALAAASIAAAAQNYAAKAGLAGRMAGEVSETSRNALNQRLAPIFARPQLVATTGNARTQAAQQTGAASMAAFSDLVNQLSRRG